MVKTVICMSIKLIQLENTVNSHLVLCPSQASVPTPTKKKSGVSADSHYMPSAARSSENSLTKMIKVCLLYKNKELCSEISS